MSLDAERSLAETIFALVKQRGGSVSFADLTLNVPGFRDPGPGGLELGYPHGENIMIWGGMSEAGAAAIRELLSAYKIELRPCAPIIYAMDGLVPDVPVAKSMRTYKQQRWLPMVLDLGAEARP